MKKIIPFIAIIASSWITTGMGLAQSEQVIFQETYDNLPLGSIVPTWIPIRPQDDPTTPTVQNVSFNSAPHGAELTNDHGSLRPFPQPLTGIVIIEIWMDPKVGSDTNHFFRLALNNASAGQDAVIRKNESDRWLYTDASSGQVFFEPVDGQGHNIRVEYNTDTATYNLFFDRDRDGDFDALDFSVFNVPYYGSSWATCNRSRYEQRSRWSRHNLIF